MVNTHPDKDTFTFTYLKHVYDPKASKAYLGNARILHKLLNRLLRHWDVERDGVPEVSIRLLPAVGEVLLEFRHLAPLHQLAGNILLYEGRLMGRGGTDQGMCHPGFGR